MPLRKNLYLVLLAVALCESQSKDYDADLTIITHVFKISNSSSPVATEEGDPAHGGSAVISRKMWGAHKPLAQIEPLTHPTDLVIISHTASQFCHTFSECSKIFRNVQDYHINSKDYKDIGYNFLVGGDGRVYEGRGWDTKNFHKYDSIGISLIGNFVYDEFTSDMELAAKNLLEFGVEMGKLSVNFKVVSHNQTTNTLSPGRNAYETIKSWTHFSSAGV